MFGFLTRDRYGPIGLDVGSEGVRMLQLEQAGGKLSLVAAAAESFPPQSPAEAADGRCRRRLAVEAVRDVLRSSRFRGRDVVSCLRTGDLAIKNIRLPQMPERELASAVVWEARERFGFEVAPDRLHYIRAGEVRQATEVREEVILLAATEEGVSEHVEMLTQMRLNPLHIDAEPVALFRAYRRFLRRAADESAVTVLVDIGLSATKVIVAKGKSILLVKLIDLAGAKFNEGVSRGLGLAWAEAAQLRKRASAGSADGQRSAGEHVQRSVLDAIRGPVEALAREISLCLRYCSVTFRGLRPAEVTLMGGEAYDPAVVKLLGECLDCACVVGEPLRGVEVGQVDLGSDRRGVLTEWSVAMGLALRDMSGGAAGRKGKRERNRVSA